MEYCQCHLVRTEDSGAADENIDDSDIYVSDTVFLTHLSQMADRPLIICPDIVFLGDMNCCPKKSDAIKEFCELYSMKNLITSPTCHKGSPPTILDVILVSQPKRFTESLNCECPLSDFHNIIDGATKQFVVRDLFPAGPISVIFVLWASISCNFDFSS